MHALNGKTAGCVSITMNNSDFCEIKRLYIRTQFRGMGLGKILLERAISDTRDIGYKFMRLDTFPFMNQAIKIYIERGFYPIEKYNDDPAKSAIFLQYDLDYSCNNTEE